MRRWRRVPPPLTRLVPIPARTRPRPGTADDLVGTDLDGNPAAITVAASGRSTLLLFLSSGCDGCRPLWAATADPQDAGLVRPGGERVVVVTRDAATEDLVELRALAGAGAAVVMSSDAWASYGVHGPPFFCLVEGVNGRVATEGVAWGVQQVAADVSRARARILS